MEILIMNYNDWIGFHLVEAFLNEGYTVHGVKGKDSNENLEDFLARNSNFHVQRKLEKKTYSFIICPGDSEQLAKRDAEQLILINSPNIKQDDGILLINIPLLYGEWMPMDEEGFYVNGHKIEFGSEIFKKEAIYIGDFITLFLQWLRKTTNLEEIRMKLGKNKDNQAVKLEKTFFVDENVPIGDELEKVITHYKKYQQFYPQVK